MTCPKTDPSSGHLATPSVLRGVGFEDFLKGHGLATSTLMSLVVLEVLSPLFLVSTRYRGPPVGRVLDVLN